METCPAGVRCQAGKGRPPNPHTHQPATGSQPALLSSMRARVPFWVNYFRFTGAHLLTWILHEPFLIISWLRSCSLHVIPISFDQRQIIFVQRIVYSDCRRTFVMSNSKRRCSAREPVTGSPASGTPHRCYAIAPALTRQKRNVHRKGSPLARGSRSLTFWPALQRKNAVGMSPARHRKRVVSTSSA